MKPLFAGLFVFAAMVFSTGVARADDMDTYVNAHGREICRIFDRKGVNETTFVSLAMAVQIDGGFSSYDSGKVLGEAVLTYCPEYYDPIVALGNETSA